MGHGHRGGSPINSPVAAFLWLLGRAASALRVMIPGGELVLARDHHLPIAQLEAVARTGDLVEVDPWVRLDGERALAALWTHATDPDGALGMLPEALTPQVLVRVAVGGVLVWLLQPPYPAEVGPDRPTAAAMLADLAMALATIPGGPDDLLPVPAREDELEFLVPDPTAAYTDLAALWSWAHEQAERIRADVLLADGGADPAREPLPAGAAAAAGADTTAIPLSESAETQEPTRPAEPTTFAVFEATPEPLVSSNADDGPGADRPPTAETAPIAGEATPADPLPGPQEAVVSATGPAEMLPMGQPSIVPPPGPGTPHHDGTVRERLDAALAAAAEVAGLLEGDALGAAIVTYAMRTLGTDATFALLGVRMTWERPDGLYGLGEHGWVKLSR